MQTFDQVTDLFYQITLLFFKIITPIVLFVAFLVLIKIFYQYQKYGHSIFSVFHKRKPFHFSKEFLFLNIDRLTCYKKLAEWRGVSSDFVMVTTTGIYLFYIFDYPGMIMGTCQAEKLQLKKRHNSPVIDIENPFFLLTQDEERIKSLFPNVVIEKILVLNDECSFNILYKEDIKVTRYYKLFYLLEGMTKQKDSYNKKEVDQMAMMIRKG